MPLANDPSRWIFLPRDRPFPGWLPEDASLVENAAGYGLYDYWTPQPVWTPQVYRAEWDNPSLSPTQQAQFFAATYMDPSTPREMQRDPFESLSFTERVAFSQAAKAVGLRVEDLATPGGWETLNQFLPWARDEIALQEANWEKDHPKIVMTMPGMQSGFAPPPPPPDFSMSPEAHQWASGPGPGASATPFTDYVNGGMWLASDPLMMDPNRGMAVYG